MAAVAVAVAMAAMADVLRHAAEAAVRHQTMMTLVT